METEHIALQAYHILNNGQHFGLICQKHACSPSEYNYIYICTYCQWPTSQQWACSSTCVQKRKYRFYATCTNFNEASTLASSQPFHFTNLKIESLSITFEFYCMCKVWIKCPPNSTVFALPSTTRLKENGNEATSICKHCCVCMHAMS